MRRIIIGFLTAVLLAFPCFAEETGSILDGLTLIELDSEKQASLWEELDLRPCDMSKERSAQITSFDVSDNGEILIGLADNEILVYNSSLELTHAYHFSVPGSFFVFWHNNQIALFSVRGQDIAIFSKGLLNHRIVQVDSKSSSDLTNHFRDKTVEKTEKQTYMLEKPDGIMGLFAAYRYDRLILKDTSGVITEVYTTGKDYNSTAVFILALLSIMLISVIYAVTTVVILPLAKRGRKTGGSSLS